MNIRPITGICEWCKQEFTHGKKLARYCSHKCASAFSAEAKRLKSQVDFLEEHGHDINMPTCKICGWKAYDLTTHITKFHKIPMKVYYTTHNCTTLDVLHEERRKERSDRKTGDKNIFYQHDGKYSHVSKKCLSYEGLSDEEKTQHILNIQKKQAEGRENGEGYTARLEYWINKGFSEEEAVIQLKNRQRTFSLDICINKHGEEKGKQIWLKRQEIWQQSYYDKTDEEMENIFKRKNTFTNGTSKLALKLFKAVKHPTAKYEDGENNNEAVISTLSGKKYSVDFFVPEQNLIIEFHGDVWHGNPKLYEANDFPIYWATNPKPAQYLWDNDERKLTDITISGYTVLVVWELDLKQNYTETIQRCRDFLGLK